MTPPTQSDRRRPSDMEQVLRWRLQAQVQLFWVVMIINGIFGGIIIAGFLNWPGACPP